MSSKQSTFQRLIGSFRSTDRNSRSATESRRAAVESLESRTLMSASPVLYASDNTGLLFTLNPTTGQTHSIGRMPEVMYDLAASPGGTLYGVDSRSNLYSINPSNASTHYIGYTGTFLNGLTFSSNGMLYGSGNNGLYTLSTSSGRATEIEALGSNNSAGDLAFDKSGNLYLTTNANYLIKINLGARTYHVVGPIGYNQVYGLVDSPTGVLYGLTNSSEQVIAINTSNGHGTLVSSFRSASVSGANGATYGPAVVSSSRPTIIASDNNGKLFTVNLGTGQTHTIGYMGVTLFDLAEDRYGDLYGVDSSSNLYRINASTAQVSQIGYTGVFLNALTFSANGTLYAAGHNGLYIISTSTGHATEVGTLGSNVSSGDLAFDANGNLYWTTTSNDLIRIDLSARRYYDVGNIGFSEVYGLAFGSDGTLYGLSNATDQVFTINLTNGHGTFLSSFAGQTNGVNGAA